MMETDPNCEFCAIGGGEHDSVERVCEGKSWVAFFPRSPATPGHTLVIPRTHVVDLWKADDQLAAELVSAVVRVGKAIDQALNPEGINLISSAGETAEQSVFHLHLHVVPRWHRDGFGHIWPPKKRYEDATIENVAARVREACGSKI
jgi:histidine triad (HIT) family protein